MKSIKSILLFTLIIFVNIKPIFSQQIIKYNKKSKKNLKPYIEGELIVKFKDSVSNFTINNTNKNNNTSIKTYSKKESNLKLLKYDKNDSIDNIIAKYKNDPNVEFVQPNYVYSINNTTPNDTYFIYQWGLQNTGQLVPPDYTAGTNDCDIDASSETENSAWDINTGSSSIIVAIIDTGVDYLHPDLSANIWTNGSGYHGYDYIDNDNDPMDLEGHGSIIAGIIGAVTNNNQGISGVAWDVKIMSVRGLDENGNGTSLTLSQSITYAVDNGAEIINASWGGYFDDATLRNSIVYAQSKNVLFVTVSGNGGADSIGDDNDVTPVYPANYHLAPYSLNNVISVAASDKYDNLASFSNYGATSVHVCAPGVNIISTVPTFSYVISKIDENRNIFIYSFFGFIILLPGLFFKKKKKYFYKKLLLILSILFILFFTVKCIPPIEEKSSSSSSKSSDPDPIIQKIVSGHDYAIASGTSVAAPFITGITVLMKAKNNTLTPSQIINYLSASLNSEDFSGTGALTNKVISDGRINAYNVLFAVPTP